MCSILGSEKNAEQIKREDFKEPKREDEYGTSVMSIQFTRGISSTEIEILDKSTEIITLEVNCIGNKLEKNDDLQK